MNAVHRTVVEGAGLTLEVRVVPLGRGTGARVGYSVTVWSTAGGVARVVEGGEALLPPALIKEAKTALWARLKP